MIISHSYAILNKSSIEPLSKITNGKLELSGVGLTIFFFISGYFVTKSARDSVNIQQFVKKRIFRIYPALIVLVIVSVFFAGPLLSTFSIQQYFSSKESWLYLFTASGLRIRMNLPGVFSSSHFFIDAFNASLWTVALEIKLYFSLGILLGLGIFKSKKLSIVICLLVIFVCFITVAFNQELSFNLKRHLNLIGIFYLGAFTYSASLSNRAVQSIFLASFIFFVIFSVFNIQQFNPFPLCLVSMCMLVFFTGFTKKVQVHLNTDISYGLYIYAFPVQQTIFMFSDNNSPLFFLLKSLALTLPFAIASWYCIEKKFIKLKYKRHIAG